MKVTFFGFAETPIEISLLETEVQLIIHPLTSLFTMKATPY